MEAIADFLTKHAGHAHWFILLGLLLAGCNIPISIDLLVILSAVLAAHFIPEHTFLLYGFVFVGCTLSAWIAYGLGRYASDKLSHLRLFAPIFRPTKIEKMRNFYQKYGIWAYIIGRFIPFGVRNCIFMTSGLSKTPFIQFALRESLACFLWVTCSYTLFFQLGQNFEKIWVGMKTVNLAIFSAFCLAVIGIIWYKLRKKRHTVLQGDSLKTTSPSSEEPNEQKRN